MIFQKMKGCKKYRQEINNSIQLDYNKLHKWYINLIKPPSHYIPPSLILKDYYPIGLLFIQFSFSRHPPSFRPPHPSPPCILLLQSSFFFRPHSLQVSSSRPPPLPPPPGLLLLQASSSSKPLPPPYLLLILVIRQRQIRLISVCLQERIEWSFISVLLQSYSQ